ncbi:MAG TPA: sugar ABC transporter permease [Ruminococcus flavefaciens]|nr:sugar ABC transporter permease [Ruminococcus flavefaciens]HQM02311.1 sugar ABC transporter permease [Ruminococcus flavefaciens]
MKKRTYSNPVGVGKFTGLLLISPFILGFLLFTLYPFVCSFILGLTDSDGISAPVFNGGENYIRMLTDSGLHKAIGVTFRYTFMLVPLKMLVSLAVALLLNMELKGMGVYRTAFYIPSILGANLSVVIMWQYLFTSGGLVDQLLGTVGAAHVSWYGEPFHATMIIVLLRLWEFGSTMVIFLSALRDIPGELYDAARTDGCGRVRAFFHITLPMLKNVIFINLVLQTISAIQEFNAPYMITGGGPMKETYTLGMLIYDEMFRFNDAGYANAVSWVMFVLIAAVVAAMYKLTGRLREETK